MIKDRFCWRRAVLPIGVVFLLPLVGCESSPDSSASPSNPTPASIPAATGGAQASLSAKAYTKAGFVTIEQDGRLWVFRGDSTELEEYQRQGELAKHVIRPGAGPDGKTLKSPDSDTILAFIAAEPGFVTEVEEGRVWVFREGSEELALFRQHGELAKHVVRPGAGPLGATLKSPDGETITAYLAAKEE